MISYAAAEAAAAAPPPPPIIIAASAMSISINVPNAVDAAPFPASDLAPAAYAVKADDATLSIRLV